jgi:hypothetical protein
MPRHASVVHAGLVGVDDTDADSAAVLVIGRRVRLQPRESADVIAEAHMGLSPGGV